MLAASFINHIDWKFTISILHVNVYLMKHKLHLLNLNTVVTQIIWIYQCPEMASLQIYVGIFSTIFLQVMR